MCPAQNKNIMLWSKGSEEDTPKLQPQTIEKQKGIKLGSK